MKSIRLLVVLVAALLLAAPGFSIDLGRIRYAKPPARPSVSSWPEGLAAAIADKTYVDGFNYQNPGYVTENVDTFFYNGDTADLNRFLEKLAKVKGMRMSVAFSHEVGKASRSVRAVSVQSQELLGLPLSQFDGSPCTWLISVTPKDWVRQAVAENVQAEVRAVIFLGDKQIKLELLQLPHWNQ